MDASSQRVMVANILLASGALMVIVGAALASTGRLLIGGVVALAGVADISIGIAMRARSG